MEVREVIKADYLIAGGGAVGMAFADELLTDTDATMVVVDLDASFFSQPEPSTVSSVGLTADSWRKARVC